MYLTCCNNFCDIVIPSLLFGTINSLIAPRLCMGPALSWPQILAVIPWMFLWSWTNLFMFCLHNQRQPDNIAEDAVNKPWRPIPSGRLTAEQARLLLWILHPLCLALALWLGGFVPYVVLTLFGIWYNELGGADSGILKNMINGVGLGCSFAGPLEVATGHSIFSGDADAAFWTGILMATFATSSHLQDFRDMAGDKLAGRKTIPLMMGDLPARVSVVAGLALWTEVASRFWSLEWVARALPLAAELTLSANLFLDRSQPGDSRSWRLWSVWVATLMAMPLMSE
ncbi:hypothetical protein PFICI_03139 [Pestalotiopsis fici W106-1]|uniref:Digeranylgeranylglyceryl phosphate synthase n=1 Tax=Pestalotiopsis fici (strain W106-1 / CGMCC3.15140) TaxID=1229662 RepID=W3XGH8_PESFW|nr:uncharacterized protein PFICI_03139 [Pestalotiopsis fici W106-1]ETS85114.1 hypothetical protein PFICI_03139 [Pestalotiopsis fici W106-1]